MVHKSFITTVILLLAAGSAFAQKGGKVSWERNPYAALKEAKTRGVPIMLYFTSKG